MGQEQKLEINFENLVDHLADGVYFANPQGIVMYANQSLAQLLGYESPSDVIAHIPHPLSPYSL